MASYLIDCEVGSDHWLEQRSFRITGSDVAAILGLNPFKTALDVWDDKMNPGRPVVVSEAMEAGNRLEGVVAEWWLDEHMPKGTVIKKAPGLYVDERNDWLAGTPDFLVYAANNQEQFQGDGGKPDAVLEVKTTRAMRYDGRQVSWHWEEAAPLMHQVQAMIYAYLLHGSNVHIVGLIGGQQLRAHSYDYDPEFIARVLGFLEDWHAKHIRDGQMPPHTHRDLDLLKRLAGDSTPKKHLQLPDKQPLLDYCKAAKEEKDAKDRKQLAQATLVRAMGDAERAEFEDGSFFTYKTNKAGVRTARAYPEAKGSSDGEH